MVTPAPATAGSLEGAMDRLFLAWTRQRSASAVLLGLKIADLDALRWIEHRGDVRPSELCRLLRMSSGGVSLVIDRLAEAGYVVRVTSPAGGNGVDVVPTLAGRTAMADQRAGLRSGVEKIGATLAGDARATVETAVAAVAAAAEQHADATQAAANQLVALAGRPAVREPTVPWG